MKRKLYIILCAALLILPPSGAAFAKEAAETTGTELKYGAEFEGGRLYRAGTFSVVELNGDYRQMGRQYGALLKDDLKTIHQTIGEVFLKKQKMSEDDLAKIAQAIFDRYPQRYKEILYGISETSGLGQDKVILINAIEWFPKINRLSFGHCSGISVWGPYAKQGTLVFGRNNDDDPLYFNFARLVVAVFKPNDGSIPTALINYAGVIYNATGMNADGLFIELNAGPWLGFSLERVSIFTTLFSYLQEYHNLAELDRAMRSTLVDICSIINVADPTRGYSYECSLWDTKRRDQDDEGIVAAANAFSLPGWSISPFEPKLEPDMSQLRKGNLLTLGAKNKGAISPAVMMKILDVPIKEGGATHGGTIYQVVAVPRDLKIWLKIPGHQDWTEIPLAPLFRKK